MLRKHVLRLDALPVLDASEVRDDCQLADSSFGLKVLHLLDHFIGGADESNFLLNDFFVPEFSERFERATRVEAIALGAQFGLLLFALDRFNRRSIERQEI